MPMNPKELEPTPEEQKAIASLKRIAKKWPKSLWLWSASGSLWVMRRGPDGERMQHPSKSGVDQAYILASVDIPNDGGDW